MMDSDTFARRIFVAFSGVGLVLALIVCAHAQ
jgi:hypothetical protein